MGAGLLLTKVASLKNPSLVATCLCNAWFAHAHRVIEQLPTLSNASSMPLTPPSPFSYHLPAPPRPQTFSCTGLSPISLVCMFSQPSVRHPPSYAHHFPTPLLSSSCWLSSPSGSTCYSFSPRCIESTKTVSFWHHPFESANNFEHCTKYCFFLKHADSLFFYSFSKPNLLSQFQEHFTYPASRWQPTSELEASKELKAGFS